MWDLFEVRRALEIEQAQAKEPLRFNVEQVRSVRGMFRLRLRKKPGLSAGSLDEALEETRAWWPGQNGGQGNSGIVKMVNADDGEVIIRPSLGASIETGSDLWIYPVDFMQALRNAWDSSGRAVVALRLLKSHSSPIIEYPSFDPDLPLRKAQKEALNLTNSQIGLLHGPPGTGKTYTLGVNVARLLAGTNWRVLITATTNTAIDEALLSVDAALDRIGRPDLKAALVRMGSGFSAEKYATRPYLLPVSDQTVLDKLRAHKLSEPDRNEVEAWIQWRDVERSIRSQIKSDPTLIFGSKRVVAATVASIFHNFEVYDAVPWNFLVVDEASQLPAATALMSATLAERTLFAGDPKQLPAVVQSEHPLCKKYLEETAFDIFMKTASSVHLNEQSRMRPEICELISKVFYRGELSVAKDKQNDPDWKAQRALPGEATKQRRPIEIQAIDAESIWSPKYQGRIRYESATACVARVQKLIATGVPQPDIWVLTPYRAQRTLLRNILYAQGLKDIAVSTVHRAQGGERRIVLFDPVEAGSKFLNGELGDRLMNVAVSRAMAKVILFVSSGDLQNKRLAQIQHLANSLNDPKTRQANLTLRDLITQFGLTERAIGKVISIGDTVGEVLEFDSGRSLILVRCRTTGRIRKYRTDIAA